MPTSLPTRFAAPLLAALALAAGCAATSHPTQRGALGTVRSTQDLLAVIDAPGPVVVETVASADWAVDRGGLINLDHPKAKAAGLKDGDEPIQIYFHVLRHPSQGLFLVDSGMEKRLRDDPGNAAIRGLVASVMHAEKVKVHDALGDWLVRQAEPVKGVFLTHLHLDHISGVPDLPAATALYAGPHEGGDHAFMNLFTQGTADRQLEGKGPLQEWPFAADPSGRFEGVLDVFGDGSVWALWVPGHTLGATAYVVRTPQGPVLLTGDACHTRWGWDNGVEPGSFTADRPRNAVALERLRRLASEHPKLDVRLGHQR